MSESSRNSTYFADEECHGRVVVEERHEHIVSGVNGRLVHGRARIAQVPQVHFALKAL